MNKGLGCTMVLTALLCNPAHALLFSATLPDSRATQVGVFTTILATMINTSQIAATGCTIGLSTPIDAGFSYELTDPGTNQPVGNPDEPVEIAAGGIQTFVLGITPNSAMPSTEVTFAFECVEHRPAIVFPGVNTLWFSASDMPTPDVIALAATPTNDGTALVPPGSGLGFFSVASINVGVEGVIDVRPRMTATVPDALLVCETDSVTGECFAEPAMRVTTPIAADATPTFSAFVGNAEPLAFDPAARRVFVEFFEGVELKGSTSVAAKNGVVPPPPGECAKNVVLMGYWPPTNEMLRQWSTKSAQNPSGWVGANWRQSGYDVYAFFPEFPPDGNPGNDPIGSPGSVGSEESDLRVDYQDTTVDFWRIVDTYQPQLLITTSRGGGIGWEVEAVEGGHGSGNFGDPSRDWSSDRHGAEFYPTQATVEPRTWDAISLYRQGNRLPSQLPMAAIVAATDALGLTSVQIDQNTSGNYLSGFLGLHGLYYNQLAPHNVTAGHIHVGGGVPVSSAVELIETTLQVVVDTYPAASVGCPEL